MNDDFMMDDTAGTDEFDGVEDTSLTPESGSDSLDGVSVQEADPFGADTQTQVRPEMPQLSMIEPGTGEPIHQSPMPSTVAEGHVGAGGDTGVLQWYQTSDGTQYAWGDDGSYYQVTPDGYVVQIAPDGSSAVTMPDGTFYAWDANGIPIELGSDPYGGYNGYGDYGDYGDNSYGDYGDTSYGNNDYDNTDSYDTDVALTEEGVYGSSYEWTEDWFFQEVDGYCGPTSVAILVNEYFNGAISDPEHMVNMAYELGLTQDISQGMTTDNILTLLQANDVPSEKLHSSMSDLETRLGSGFGVIAIVDSGELWGDEADQYFEDNVYDHALVVTEVDTVTGTVTLADPGIPDGNGFEVSIAEFEDAWADSGFEMISTTDPDSDLVATDPDTVSAGGAVGAGTESAERPNLALVNLAGTGPIK